MKNNNINDNIKKVIPYRRDSGFFFRVGLRCASEGKLESARSFLTRAVEKEPFNADYQLNLACVLAELNEINKSNEIMNDIIKNMDPTLGECYFGLACNYFDTGNFKKARENFERYLFYDNEGRYIDEAYDILYYLQIYDEVGSGRRRGKTLSKLETDGISLLEAGSYEKAAQKFGKIIEADPEVISPRNNLSLAYYLSGDIDRAVSLAKSVLKLDPQNILAHCNLALFYSADRELSRKELGAISELPIDNKSDFMKAIYTFSELKEHAGVSKILENYINNNSRARQTLRAVLKDETMEPYIKAEIKGALDRAGASILKSKRRIAPAKVINLKKRTNK